MRLRLLKAKHWMLVALMGLTGLATSCAKEPADMYGCPPSAYNDSLPKE